MTKKKNAERVFATPDEEIAYLKKQAAGLKGYINSLTKKNDELTEHCKHLVNDIKVLSDANKGLSRMNVVLDARIKEYQALPWYKRIFKTC